jgi:hypothetical protein
VRNGLFDPMIGVSLALFGRGVSPSLWQELVHTLAPDLDAELNPEAFERASRYVVAKVDELNDGEALLVSVG